MNEQLKQIARRLRGIREIEGITDIDLAKEFNIDIETYQQYESGNVDIPVSFLYEVANRFGVELTAILSGEDPKLKVYSVVRAGKGLEVQRRQDYMYQNLAYNFSNKKIEPFLVEVPISPDDASVPQNVHPGQEFDYLIEGTLKVVINNKEIILNPGDSIYYDSNYPHGMKAMNNQKAKFLAIIL